MFLGCKTTTNKQTPVDKLGAVIEVGDWWWRHQSYWEILCLFVVILRPSNIKRTYQDGHWLLTMHTHADFIVLPHWKPKPPSSGQHYDLISHSDTLSWHWANQSLPCPTNAKRQARKQEQSILKSLVWLDQDSNPQSPKSEMHALLIRQCTLFILA